jgi:ribonuclease HII
MADLRMERVLQRHGYVVIGVDEAGRGPLAGPVVAGAAILPPEAELPGVNDSKQLSEKKREIAYERILQVALAWGVGIIDHERIDRINIRNATFEAMAQAVTGTLAMARERGLSVEKPCLLIDGNALVPSWTGDQRWVIGGDRKVLSIAAGSILAKVTRDRLLLELDREYPVYGFAQHKGYGTALHLDALRRYGPCPAHRRSFEPLKSMLSQEN